MSALTATAHITFQHDYSLSSHLQVTPKTQRACATTFKLLESKGWATQAQCTLLASHGHLEQGNGEWAQGGTFILLHASTAVKGVQFRILALALSALVVKIIVVHPC